MSYIVILMSFQTIYSIKLENTCMQKPSPSDETIVFSEHEVSKAVVMVTRSFFKNILTNEKSLKNITFNYKIINFPTYIC
jgi:hypothetical protein